MVALALVRVPPRPRPLFECTRLSVNVTRRRSFFSLGPMPATARRSEGGSVTVNEGRVAVLGLDASLGRGRRKKKKKRREKRSSGHGSDRVGQDETSCHTVYNSRSGRSSDSSADDLTSRGRRSPRQRRDQAVRKTASSASRRGCFQSAPLKDRDHPRCRGRPVGWERF